MRLLVVTQIFALMTTSFAAVKLIEVISGCLLLTLVMQFTSHFHPYGCCSSREEDGEAAFVTGLKIALKLLGVFKPVH